MTYVDAATAKSIALPFKVGLRRDSGSAEQLIQYENQVTCSYINNLPVIVQITKIKGAR